MIAKRAKLWLRQEVVVWFILVKLYTTAHSGFKGHQYFFPKGLTMGTRVKILLAEFSMQ